jgi:hypothetical protein
LRSHQKTTIKCDLTKKEMLKNPPAVGEIAVRMTDRKTGRVTRFMATATERAEMVRK